jgi:NAD(P)H-dependent FMN reductase
MRILAICGSLRASSTNRSALEAAAMLAPAGMATALYEGLAHLPHFNSDLDTAEPPDAVLTLRREIGLADGLVISSPEYAHGVPGPLKNVLDWLVASFEFPVKPVMLINASPRAVHADQQLREILRTMSARLIGGSSVVLPLLGRNLTASDIASDPELSRILRTALADFAKAIRSGAS